MQNILDGLNYFDSTEFRQFFSGISTTYINELNYDQGEVVKKNVFVLDKTKFESAKVVLDFLIEKKGPQTYHIDLDVYVLNRYNNHVEPFEKLVLKLVEDHIEDIQTAVFRHLIKIKEALYVNDDIHFTFKENFSDKTKNTKIMPAFQQQLLWMNQARYYNEQQNWHTAFNKTLEEFSKMFGLADKKVEDVSITVFKIPEPLSQEMLKMNIQGNADFAPLFSLSETIVKTSEYEDANTEKEAHAMISETVIKQLREKIDEALDENNQTLFKKLTIALNEEEIRYKQLLQSLNK